MIARFFSTVLLHNVDPAWSGEESAMALDAVQALSQAMLALGHAVIVVPLRDDGIQAALSPFSPDSHIVFNWCEGIPGQDHSEAEVARVLEALGFIFTGAGADVLELSGDKRRVKERLDCAGIPTPDWRLFHTAECRAWTRFPAIVKPVNEHCSEGITSEAVVMDSSELTARITYILETYQQAALVEDFIDGREFHVSLWGNGHVDMLPPAEMDFSGFPAVKDRLCTYDSKFVPGSRHYEGIQTVLPAPLSPEELGAMEAICRKAYRTIGCRDYGRLDLRARDGVFYVLDVNPNADISFDASLACAAEVAGHSYGEAGSHILSLAALRHPGSRGGSGLGTPGEEA